MPEPIRLSDERIASLVPVPQPVEFHLPLADDKRFIGLRPVRPRPSVRQLLRLVAHFHDAIRGCVAVRWPPQ